jgi:hypothetical protein
LQPGQVNLGRPVIQRSGLTGIGLQLDFGALRFVAGDIGDQAKAHRQQDRQ